MRNSRFFISAAVLVFLALGTSARAQQAEAENQVIKLLHEFLNKVEDPAMHDRFWADDLIYTSGKGVKRSKAEIMKSMRGSKPKAVTDETYEAEDITTHAYPKMVVLNFRLVQHLKGPNPETHTFRNTGVFMRRDGKWQVVAWQATPEEKQPPDEDRIQDKK